MLPLVLGALGAVRGDAELAAMYAEHAHRRQRLGFALRAVEALGTYEIPGDVYGMTDALVNLEHDVTKALDDEERFLRSAADRTDGMNYDGSGG